MRTLQRKLARRDNDVIKMERELHKLRVRAYIYIFVQYVSCKASFIVSLHLPPTVWG